MMLVGLLVAGTAALGIDSLKDKVEKEINSIKHLKEIQKLNNEQCKTALEAYKLQTAQENQKIEKIRNERSQVPDVAKNGIWAGTIVAIAFFITHRLSQQN